MQTRRPNRRLWTGLCFGAPLLFLLGFLTLQGEAYSVERVAEWTQDTATLNDPDDEEVTFTRDVAPILQENCQLCHQPGSIGPMSFMTYDEVRPWAPIIKEQVVSRNMPPYHYDRGVGIQELKNDTRLSEEEIRTIVRWVDAGAPEGDPADLPPPAEFPDPSEWRLADQFGQPDIVVPSEPFTVPATGQDMWWQPVVPIGNTEDRCIRAIEVKPSVEGRAATHHANTNVVQEIDGNLIPGQFLTEYALGKLGEIIPEDACRLLPAGSHARWDIHYFPSGQRLEDHVVELGLWFYPDDFNDESLYRQNLSLYFLEGGQGFDIEPHGTLMTQGFHSFNTPVRIDSFQPHGHLRLRAKSLEIYHPDTGRREMVSMVSNWNPGWHLSHVYEDHVAPLVPAGSVLIITAWYDNTADNPWNPDPDQWVGIGNRTTDEMSHAWIAVTHLDEQGYQELVAEREAMEAEDDLAGDD